MDVKLTNVLFKRILLYLSYNDLLRSRLVSKKFNTIAQEILNNALFDMNDRLKDMLETVNLKLQGRSVSQNTLRYFKITNYLRSEINLIIATTFVYMKEGHYSFGGACILDFYEKFLKLPFMDFENNFEYMTIYHMIESYLNNFDERIEPRIVKKHREYQNTWFGMKLINLLDSSLDLNCRLEISNDVNDLAHLDGNYYGTELELLENVPIMKELKTDNDKRSFIQSIRNNIRWSNLLYCIERSTDELAVTSLQPGQQMMHRNSTIYEKSVKDKLEKLQSGVFYKINLKCHKMLLPLRASSTLAQSTDTLSTTLKWNVSLSSDKQTAEYPFEMNVLMKMKTQDKDGLLSEKVTKISTVGTTCFINQNVKRSTSLDM